jgi:hypothetical protein
LIADFLCLFVIIQIPLAGAYQFANEETTEFFWLLTGATWVVAPVIWFTATRALSRAGVSGGKHRMLFMGLIVPVAYYGIIPFAFLTIGSVAAIFTGDESQLWLVLIWLALGVSLFLSGLYTRRMVGRVEGNLNHEDKDDTRKTVEIESGRSV